MNLHSLIRSWEKPLALVLSSPLGEAGSMIPDSHAESVQECTWAHLPTRFLSLSQTIPGEPALGPGTGPGEQNQLHNLRGPVQIENAKPLAQNVLTMSRR